MLGSYLNGLNTVYFDRSKYTNYMKIPDLRLLILDFIWLVEVVIMLRKNNYI